MALNRIEDRQLWHHDKDGDTLEVAVVAPSMLRFDNSSAGYTTISVFAGRDAVETLRDCLTRWLETGKFTLPTEATEHYNMQARGEQ